MRSASSAVSRMHLYRVREWIHILPLPLATFDARVPLDSALAAAARGVLNAGAILAFGFLVNSIADRDVDRDPRKNPFIDAQMAAHRSVLVALPMLSLCLAWLSPWPAGLATVWCLALGCVYSTGPRLKRIPVLGTVLNAAGFTPILFLGMATPSVPERFAWVALAFAALLFQNQLLHEAADRDDDSASGIRTTWLTLGAGWSAALAAGAGLLAAASSSAVVVASPWWGGAVGLLVGAGFAVVVPLQVASAGLSQARAAHLRVAHRWCCLATGAILFVIWRSG